MTYGPEGVDVWMLIVCPSNNSQSKHFRRAASNLTEGVGTYARSSFFAPNG